MEFGGIAFTSLQLCQIALRGNFDWLLLATSAFEPIRGRLAAGFSSRLPPTYLRSFWVMGRQPRVEVLMVGLAGLPSLRFGYARLRFAVILIGCY